MHVYIWFVRWTPHGSPIVYIHLTTGLAIHTSCMQHAVHMKGCLGRGIWMYVHVRLQCNMTVLLVVQLIVSKHESLEFSMH